MKIKSPRIPKSSIDELLILAVRIVAVAILVLPVANAQEPKLGVTVNAAVTGEKFPAYVGGGANISPPDTIGGGGGIPLISMSNGATFLAGEIRTSSPKFQIMRITFTVQNSGQTPIDFKIGDVTLKSNQTKWDEFMAVGYGDKLCAMNDEDRKKVKEIKISLKPGEQARLIIAFPVDAGAKSGDLLVAGAKPVHFEIADPKEN
ncbi:MAG TPA: hypothetical protein VJR23_03435 [Candidatus Acidoferrales bacterium]|nr:hypothetical protein [Candidatus Acidoferrales bacterium]